MSGSRRDGCRIQAGATPSRKLLTALNLGRSSCDHPRTAAQQSCAAARRFVALRIFARGIVRFSVTFPYFWPPITRKPDGVAGDLVTDAAPVVVPFWITVKTCEPMLMAPAREVVPAFAAIV